MAKYTDKQCESPSSSLPTYVFNGPSLIAIRTRTNDQPKYVDTRLSIWTWYDGGVAMKIDWAELNFSPDLMEIAKAFLAYALEKYAPLTAFSASVLLRRLAENVLSAGFPWALQDVVAAVNSWSKFRHSTVLFRTFYRWALNRGISGFNKETYLAIKEIKGKRNDPYERIFLAQSGLDLDEEVRLLKRIDRDIQASEWQKVQFNIILHLSFELGPRSIQFHSLDVNDFEYFESAVHNNYYTIWLPMAKKFGQRRPERRPRKITTRLGDKIRQHVSEVQRRFGPGCEPLFVSPAGKRLSVVEIGMCLKHELRSAGVSKPNQVSMLLRHHLGQGLADQGTPADMIAEMLGHNSTVAARAYVAATPNIARIKERALGKSPTYQRIMRSLLTGEIAQRDHSKAEREVRGVIDTQYIGDIGACALPTHTACPYNPVYACYTCKKFHPFADGRHEQVKGALQQEAQRFIDAAEQAGDLSHNRPLAQHQTTILAVSVGKRSVFCFGEASEQRPIQYKVMTGDRQKRVWSERINAPNLRFKNFRIGRQRQH